MFMPAFKDLDPVLHSQLRLAIMSVLMAAREVDFTTLRERTGATAGNLSVQIQKLRDAGYIDVLKQFRENYPQTICRLLPQGEQAYRQYVLDLRSYLGTE